MQAIALLFSLVSNKPISDQSKHFSPFLPAPSKPKPEMVLEDVDSDHEEPVRKGDAPSPAVPPETRPTLTGPVEPVHDGVDGTAARQEDAETQTGRWTPLINTIKREAEDVALATMEER